MPSSSQAIAIPKFGDRLLLTAALILFGVSLYCLVTYQPSHEGPAGLVPIGSVTTDSPVRRRHAGSLAWSEIDGEGEIFLRDLVYTPAGVNASVKMSDGRVVSLPPDSLVQFDDITVSNLEITLRDFAEPKRQVFRLVPIPKAQRSRTLPDPSGLEALHAELMKKYEQSRAGRGERVGVKKVTAAPEMGMKDLSDFEIKLQYPEDGQSMPYLPDNWTKIAWSPVPAKDVTYQVEVSLKEKFEKKLPYSSQKNWLEIQFDKPGKYYWRVMATSPRGMTSSTTRTFTLFPQGKRELSADVTAKDFNKFFVEVSNNEEFSSVLTSRGATQPKCSTVGLPTGNYFCRVRKGDASKSIVTTYPFDVK